jgi:hypothetical protein
MTVSTEIPEPPALPILGHITYIDNNYTLGSFLALTEEYGEQIARVRSVFQLSSNTFP